jgi:hypothetical protein
MGVTNRLGWVSKGKIPELEAPWGPPAQPITVEKCKQKLGGVGINDESQMEACDFAPESLASLGGNQ